jgi:hypothetical protein
LSDRPAGPAARGRRHDALPASPETDALYGLEPVIEVGEGGGSDLLEGFVTLSCPYCAESYGVAVDLSAGSQSYIEDCQVCCQPINLQLTVTDSGEFASLNAERIDR